MIAESPEVSSFEKLIASRRLNRPGPGAMASTVVLTTCWA